MPDSASEAGRASSPDLKQIPYKVDHFCSRIADQDSQKLFEAIDKLTDGDLLSGRLAILGDEIQGLKETLLHAIGKKEKSKRPHPDLSSGSGSKVDHFCSRIVDQDSELFEAIDKLTDGDLLSGLLAILADEIRGLKETLLHAIGKKEKSKRPRSDSSSGSGSSEDHQSLRKSCDETFQNFQNFAKIDPGFVFLPNDSALATFLIEKALEGHPRSNHLIFTVEDFFRMPPDDLQNIFQSTSPFLPFDGKDGCFYFFTKLNLPREHKSKKQKKEQGEKDISDFDLGNWTPKKYALGIYDNFTGKKVGHKVIMRHLYRCSSIPPPCESDTKWMLSLFFLDFMFSKLEWALAKLYRVKMMEDKRDVNVNLQYHLQHHI